MSTPFQLITEYRVFGAEDVIRTQKEIIESFRAGELTVKEANAAFKQNMEVTRELNRAQSGLRMATRVQNYEFTQSLQIMRGVGNIGQSLMSMWQAYEIGQIRVDAATRNVTKATLDVAQAQKLYDQYLQDFGSESVLTKDALDKLNEARGREKDSLDGLAKSQASVNAGYFTMGLNLFGVIGQVGMLYLKIEQMGGLSAALSPLTSALGGIVTSLGGAAVVGGAAVGVGGVLAAGWYLEQTRGVAGMREVEKALGRIREPYTHAVGVDSYEYLKSLGGQIRGAGQFGIPNVPITGEYYLHAGERVLTKAQVNERISTKIFRTNVTMHNIITKEADADKVADRAYKRLIKKLGG